MEPEIIDWNNIDSVFIEDDTYENLNAPKWVDFSVPDEQPIDDDAWFCNPGMTHLDFLGFLFLIILRLVTEKVIRKKENNVKISCKYFDFGGYNFVPFFKNFLAFLFFI